MGSLALEFELTATRFPQVFRVSAANSSQTPLDIFRLDIFVDLSQTRFEFRLLRLYIR